MSAIRRGLTNPVRNKARAIVVVALLSLVTGFLALMVQATVASRQQIASMESRVRTLVELGVMSPPSIAIDGELVFPKLPTPEKLRAELLKRLP